MLKKFTDPDIPVEIGAEIFLVTRGGEVLDGFRIKSVLVDLVALDRAPFPDSDKQGFTLDNGRLRPNWCEGRRRLVAGYLSRQEAEDNARRRR